MQSLGNTKSSLRHHFYFAKGTEVANRWSLLVVDLLPHSHKTKFSLSYILKVITLLNSHKTIIIPRFTKQSFLVIITEKNKNKVFFGFLGV